jgi:hypothetical protein
MKRKKTSSSRFTGPLRSIKGKLKKLKPSRNSKSLKKGKPKAKPVKKKTRRTSRKMADEKAAEAAKEAASRISGKIRNLENEINSRSSSPPDPGIAAQFDAIQRELEALKSGESGSQFGKSEENDEQEHEDKAKKKK